MEPLIEIKGLKKYFKTPAGLLHAVDDVNLSIAKGETLGIVGESGCGKSTLGRVIIKLLEPTEGSILFEGTDIAGMKSRQLKEFRKDAQIIFQDPYASLNPRMSVFDLIAEPMIVNHIGKSKSELRDRVLELMETVGLAPRLASAYPHELDGGRRQRIGVAHALAVNPKFIVCDEPVSALDVSIQAQILNLLMDLQEKRNLTYLFITHDLSVVKHISNEIAVMYLGQCVEKASAEELFINPLHPYTKALLEAIPVPNLKNRGKAREVLTGEVTNPINPGIGCRFAPRCRYASEQCINSSIRLKEQSKGHQVACILY